MRKSALPCGARGVDLAAVDTREIASLDHNDWRRGIARDLAREFAPVRINIVGGGAQHAREEALAYLRDAPGITGQYLALND